VVNLKPLCELFDAVGWVNKTFRQWCR